MSLSPNDSLERAERSDDTLQDFVGQEKEEQMQIPTIDEAGVLAVGLCEHLPARDQAFFIAGFQEAIKFLMSNDQVDAPSGATAERR